MRLLLVPDPTAPNGIDAFCKAMAARAAQRGDQAVVQASPNGRLEESDVVVINSLQPAALLAARAAGKKIVLRLIDSYADADAQALADVRRLALQANLILVPSLYLKDIVHSWRRAQDEARHVPCSISGTAGANGSVIQVPYAYEHILAQQIALVTVRASRPRGFPLVASAPLNAATKPGMETLLSAVARLRLDCHLTIIGDGPALPALKSRVQQLVANDKIDFLGDLPHAKIMEYLRSAKIYIDPCGLEGFPMLTLQALSHGCPVVGARAGALPELIRDGENGLLFSPGDALGLSEAVVTLSSVAGLSLRLIEGGIKTVEKHSWDATASAAFSALDLL